MMIDEAVSPFAQGGTDKSFGFAVGLRAVGFGEAMAQAQAVAGMREVPGTKARPVVGQDTADGDTEAGEGANSVFQESNGTRLARVGVYLSETKARMIVNGDEQALKACAPGMARGCR